ncbi:metallophosphoesterase [bacterium]|nr:metallophosphoesterase [bacterium]
MDKQQIIIWGIVAYMLIRCFMLEPNSLVVTKYEVSDKSLEGIRVVFFSDLHLKKHDFKKLDKVVKLVNEQKPDVVLIGGDFAWRQDIRKSMNMKIAAQKLNLIDAPVYAVLGENDWWSDGKQITEDLRNNGIYVLENSNRRLMLKRKYIDVIGIADLKTRQPNIDYAFRRTLTPRLVVTHNPDIYYDIANDANMIFAGHTHGGQFIIPFTPPLFVPSKFGAEFASGMVQKGKNKMIITRGVGTSKVPVRFNCKPEIVVVDFTK